MKFPVGQLLIVLLMMCFGNGLAFAFGTTGSSSSTSTNGSSDDQRMKIVFLISSQNTSYHRQLSDNLRNNIMEQSRPLRSDYIIQVYVLNEIFNHLGYWTLTPLLPKLMTTSDLTRIDNRTKWIIWCDESTRVKVGQLLRSLSHEDSSELTFLGHSLYDLEPSAMHHYMQSIFPYPLLKSGVVFSYSFLNRTSEFLSRIADQKKEWRIEIYLDPSFELALYTMQGFDGNTTLPLKHTIGEEFAPPQKSVMRKVAYICPDATNASCAMYPDWTLESCRPISRAEIFFAVKTHFGNHRTRLPILQSTWTPFAKYKAFYSNVTDPEIPTVDVGVPNVVAGHCEKTLKILKLALSEVESLNNLNDGQSRPEQLNANITTSTTTTTTITTTTNAIRWIFLCDDDTLLSVARVGEFLGCFNSSENHYIGERFGLCLNDVYNGFNYITSGGGVAFSLSTVRKIIQNCNCYSDDEADDLLIGLCLRSLGISATHSSRFHQYTPLDYSPELITLGRPISFHKFYNNDPNDLYENFFLQDDLRMLKGERTLLRKGSTPIEQLPIRKSSTNPEVNQFFHGL